MFFDEIIGFYVVIYGIDVETYCILCIKMLYNSVIFNRQKDSGGRQPHPAQWGWAGGSRSWACSANVTLSGRGGAKIQHPFSFSKSRAIGGVKHPPASIISAVAGATSVQHCGQWPSFQRFAKARQSLNPPHHCEHFIASVLRANRK